MPDPNSRRKQSRLALPLKNQQMFGKQLSYKHDVKSQPCGIQVLGDMSLCMDCWKDPHPRKSTAH